MKSPANTRLPSASSSGFPPRSDQLPDVSPLPAQPARLAARNLLWTGLLLVVAGMCALPAGPSFNPSKPYQYMLALTLYLPALVIGFSAPRRWLEMARQPLMPWVLALFAWAVLSLSWTNAKRPSTEFLRLLTVLMFLFAFVHGVGNDLRRQRWLLICGAGVMTLTAVAAMIQLAVAPMPDGRLAGFGVMANANLVAAGLGAGVIWLWPWRFPEYWQRLLKWLAMMLMTAALLLTYSRSAWAGLFVCGCALLMLTHTRHAWKWLALLCVVGLGAAAAAYPQLTERGLSFRPQIFAHAFSLFTQHPLLGQGLGASFSLPVETGSGEFQVHTHNLFTQLAVELGMPGLLLWLVVWLGLGLRAWKHRQQPTGRVVLGLWLFSSVIVQFDLPHLIDSPRPGWLIIWLPLALSLSLPSTTTRRPGD